MSLQDLKRKGIAVNAAAPATKPAVAKPARATTSPGQRALMEGELNELENRAEMAERKARELEARVKDLEQASLPVAQMSPNRWQPRRLFDPIALQKLANSIAEVGLIQPIIVRRVRSSDTPGGAESVRTSDTSYEIVVGERRWRATQLLGSEHIKAIVAEVSDEDMICLALAENYDRVDLTDYEYAISIRNSESLYPNRKRLAAVLGIGRTELYQYLAFFKLPAFMLEDLELTPDLIGRSAAEDIARVVAAQGAQSIETLKSLWKQLKAGTIDQGKISTALEATASRRGNVRTERDIKKLFVGKEQAGSITRDVAGLSIKIRAAALSPDLEAKLREFVEGMFVAQ